MNIVVTGLPRTRTSLILNSIADNFKLEKPKNIWGETHKFGENLEYWLNKKDCVYKFWPVHSDRYIQQLEEFPDIIIVSYIENLHLFIAKLLRAEFSKEWGINLRQINKIRFQDSVKTLQQLEPAIIKFKNGLDTIFKNKNIIMKSIFINNENVSTHIQARVEPILVEYIRTIVKDFKIQRIEDYIEDKNEFVNFLLEKYGNSIS